MTSPLMNAGPLDVAAAKLAAMNAAGTGGRAADASPIRLQLCLVSHTNAGKTTLARTLLLRDVGEVRDAAHVTETADAYTLFASPEGDELTLWDTPGFGDSVRLAKRLEQSGNPVGWFLSEVWDRMRDRPFWLSQRALMAARDHADVVLYLVNASEDPQDAGYVIPEMQLLQWLGKPVVVLLNQMGPPAPAHAEQADVRRWTQALRASTVVRDVLPMDAFARCWVHEGVLFEALIDLAPPEKRAGAARLVASWEARNTERFEASMQALAELLVTAAREKQAVADGTSRLQKALYAIKPGKRVIDPAQEEAMRAMVDRVAASEAQTTLQLLALHGLDGAVASRVNERLSEHFSVRSPVDVKQASLLGAILSGAATGASADALSVGLTMGSGMVVGAVVGAATFAGAAWGVNKASGADRTTLRLSNAFLRALVEAGLLRYLAITHFGRGRGNFVEGEAPAFWRDDVTRVVAERMDPLQEAWTAARDRAQSKAVQHTAGPSKATDDDALVATLARLLADAMAHLLEQLYPEAEKLKLRHIEDGVGDAL